MRRSPPLLGGTTRQPQDLCSTTDPRALRETFGDTLELLKAAQKRGPRWADASKAEGDALFRIGRFKDAVRRYEAAAERAPRWGALHLAWGKALARSGRARDEEATWQAAAGMHLTAAERAQVQALLARRIT